ncbi:hypothetical protein BRADI_5g01080v3 [Brachypodium distachyon]|uniref:Rx N-terminal domain-containing protein n=1 Tax=Brachypodium distachyon TaxID=15368 RepID=A0A0Q3E5L7_BRADI|nr:hypothetical protein BRADI_5g01080v3 [Brachypodium distachyon]
MEVAISAVAGELVSRFISFLINKYNSSSHAQLEEGTEADARYITNSGMMMQLKMLSEAMYAGYCLLDTLRYRTLHDSTGFDGVSINDSSSSSLYLAIPLKRSQKTTQKDDSALESLEIAVANMAEFVVLLDGCERMSRRPYDLYLYTDNFMFGRHAEKQKLLSFLLQHNDPPAGDHAPAILPIIGGAAVGKKTLVAQACGDERVRSGFSSVLHLNVIEFASDVGNDDWKKFHSFIVRMGRGSKIIIISRLERLARFGSVKPIFLGVMSYDELRYLLKTLAFGSADPAKHPRLVQIADEFAKVLHSAQGSLVSTNTFADVLRTNLDVQFWRCVLDKGIRMVKRNLSIYGVHPTTLIQQGHPVDITDFASHPLSMTRYTINVSIKEELPSVTFGQLLTDPSVRPKQDFILISWVSRMAPHNSFARLVTSHAQGRHEGSNALPGRKRRGVPI